MAGRTAPEVLRTVTATRYVTPLREGGSLPALVEADDDGLYVVKFRGAGQGPKALVAEVVVGELARALGLPIPELAFVEVAAALSGAEPDPDIQELLAASAGCNLGLDFLPGSLTLGPSAARAVPPELAARIVWFDALTTNIDRTPRNPNLLVWHGQPYLIDHGAALYVHHTWADPQRHALGRFPASKDHVLLDTAGPIPAAHAELAPLVTAGLLDAILALVPDAWLTVDVPFAAPDGTRAAYRDYLLARVAAGPGTFVEEVERARTAR
ncbi:MAG: hypothetical protein JWM48_2959 [Mycobacterium sp.]|nr:hypothetical protein [Mycobacterium sp.]